MSKQGSVISVILCHLYFYLVIIFSKEKLLVDCFVLLSLLVNRIYEFM